MTGRGAAPAGGASVAVAPNGGSSIHGFARARSRASRKGSAEPGEASQGGDAIPADRFPTEPWT